MSLAYLQPTATTLPVTVTFCDVPDNWCMTNHQGMDFFTDGQGNTGMVCDRYLGVTYGGTNSWVLWPAKTRYKFDPNFVPEQGRKPNLLVDSTHTPNFGPKIQYIRYALPGPRFEHEVSLHDGKVRSISKPIGHYDREPFQLSFYGARFYLMIPPKETNSWLDPIAKKAYLTASASLYDTWPPNALFKAAKEKNIALFQDAYEKLKQFRDSLSPTDVGKIWQIQLLMINCLREQAVLYTRMGRAYHYKAKECYLAIIELSQYYAMDNTNYGLYAKTDAGVKISSLNVLPELVSKLAIKTGLANRFFLS